MDPILIDVPLQIETDRLILRAPQQAGDGDVVHQAIKDSINELKQWLLLFQAIPTVEETEILLRNAHIDFFEKRKLSLSYLS
jgi:ribosomal-protein-serine acetyltransferase